MGLREKVILVHSKDQVGGHAVSMNALTKEEELYLDRYDQRNVYFYGDVDLTKEEDLRVLKDYNFVSQHGNSWLNSHFNYEDGNFRLEQRAISNNPEHAYEYVIVEGPTHDPIAWFKYQYTLLGKPPKVVVYKDDFYEQFKRDFKRRR